MSQNMRQDIDMYKLDTSKEDDAEYKNLVKRWHIIIPFSQYFELTKT